MEKNYVWQDINYRKYKLQEIDDRYLYNILKFISNGGGNIEFLDDAKIETLFNEAQKRKIKHNFTLEQLISAFHERLSYECLIEDWWNYMGD